MAANSPTTTVSFRDFPEKRFVQSFRFQKSICRALKELSIDIRKVKAGTILTKKNQAEAVIVSGENVESFTSKDVVLIVLIGIVAHTDETGQTFILDEFVDQVFIFLFTRKKIGPFCVAARPTQRTNKSQSETNLKDLLE